MDILNSPEITTLLNAFVGDKVTIMAKSFVRVYTADERHG